MSAKRLRILITGGAGYLGSVISERLLEAGHRVTAVDNLMYQQNSLFHLCADPNFEFIIGDVRTEALMAKVIKDADVIIPLAAIVGAPACDRDPWLAQSVNVDAVRLINRLRGKNQLVIFPTTNSGYGTKSGGTHCTEETPLEPISLYGRTKVDAETDVLNTPNSVSLRLATVFGVSPRMRLDLLVNHFVYAAITDGYLVIFEKDFKRNYVHIRDVADCILYCIEQAGKMAGRAYNVGLDAANLSKEELARKVQAYVPNFYLHFAEVGHDPDQRNYIVSNEKIEATGYKPQVSLDVGIGELIKGYTMIRNTRYGNV